MKTAVKFLTIVVMGAMLLSCSSQAQTRTDSIMPLELRRGVNIETVLGDFLLSLDATILYFQVSFVNRWEWSACVPAHYFPMGDAIAGTFEALDQGTGEIIPVSLVMLENPPPYAYYIVSPGERFDIQSFVTINGSAAEIDAIEARMMVPIVACEAIQRQMTIGGLLPRAELSNEEIASMWRILDVQGNTITTAALSD